MVARRRPPTDAAPSSCEIYCHPHAVERFREHDPRAEFSDLLGAWDAGEPISAELAHALAGRAVVRPGSWYRIAPGGRGVLVVAPNRASGRRRWVMITYLRLGMAQQRMVVGW